MGKTKFAPFILNNFTLAAVQIALVCLELIVTLAIMLIKAVHGHRTRQR